MSGEVPNNQQEQAQNSNDAGTLLVHAQRTQTIDRVGHGDDALNRILTRKERAVLQVITNPALRDVSTDERVAAARVSRRRYFEIMADPWFRRLHREFVHTTVAEQVSAFVGASAATALTPGRDGFQDRRMLLEMSGHYIPRQQIDHTTAGQPIVGVVGVAMDEV